MFKKHIDSVNAKMMHFGRLQREALDGRLANEGIFWGQPPVLSFIAENDGCIQNSIAEAVRCKPSTITSTLNTLEQNGLIERKSSAEDKRIQRISLTEKGVEKVAVMERIFDTTEKEFLSSLTEDEERELCALLDKLISGMENRRDD